MTDMAAVSMEVPVALAEFLRVLSDDGIVVITSLQVRSDSALIAKEKIRHPTQAPGCVPV